MESYFQEFFTALPGYPPVNKTMVLFLVDAYQYDVHVNI